MHISWGYKIAILYLGFISMIISLVVFSSASQAELERSDYYEEELRHGEKMTAITNLLALNEDLSLETQGHKLILHHPKLFAEKNATVNLWIYFAGDSRNDKKLTYSCQGDYYLHTGEWAPGIYQLRFNITCDNKKFFSEKQLTIKR